MLPTEASMNLQHPPMAQNIELWPIDKLVFYARNPRKNDSAVDRMCSSIREFGFKIPVLARRDGEVVDGHLRLKAARKFMGAGHERDTIRSCTSTGISFWPPEYHVFYTGTSRSWHALFQPRCR